MNTSLDIRRVVLAGLMAVVVAPSCAGSGVGSSRSSTTMTTNAPQTFITTDGTQTTATAATTTVALPNSGDFLGTDPTRIPVGDGHRSADSAAIGSVFSCQSMFNGGGAHADGPWIDGYFWNRNTKIVVQGSVSWASSAAYSATIAGSDRVISTEGVPTTFATGIFPISPTDRAYQYDRNPNSIAAQTVTLDIPANPVLASTPTCLGMGAIGYFTNGVALFNSLDAQGRDAGAHEIQDSCGGHPERTSMYHYHDASSCFVEDAPSGYSTLIGYALDGFGIYLTKDANGVMPTNSDLDACHGRVSRVKFNGVSQDMYHYEATLEYPYTVGCFAGVR